MDDAAILYDDTEQTSTRFVGYAGDYSRFDVAITQTGHFYGKRLVTIIQNGRTAILAEEDAANTAYLMEAYGITDEQEAGELSEFLQRNL